MLTRLLVTMYMLFCALALLPLAGQAAPPFQPRLPEGVEVLRDLEYARVGEKPLLLDLYRSTRVPGKLPLIVWVHGGGWRQGSKAQCHPAMMMLSRGYAVASINYRLSDEAVFPAQIEDCKAAIRWLRAHAQQYRLDPDRFGAWGSSAGGHLVALLGTSGGVTQFDQGQHRDVSSRVQAVCDFYGPSDLLAMMTDPNFPRAGQPNSPESLLLGGTVKERTEVARRASPVTHIDKDTPPFLIVHGDRDPVVPVSQSQRLAEALKQAGIETILHVIPGARHGGPEFITPEMQQAVAAFFDKHLKDALTR